MVDELKFCVAHGESSNCSRVIDLFDRRVLRSVEKLERKLTKPEFWDEGLYIKPLNSNQILVATYVPSFYYPSSFEVIDIRKGSMVGQ